MGANQSKMVKPYVRHGKPQVQTFKSGATIDGQKSNQKRKNLKRAEQRGRKIRKVGSRRKSEGEEPDSDSKPISTDRGAVKNFRQATPRVFPKSSSIKKRRNVAGRRKSEGDEPESSFEPPLRSILRKTAVLPTTTPLIDDESEDGYQVRNDHSRALLFIEIQSCAK